MLSASLPASPTFAGSLTIAGGAVVLVGAVITIASFTPSYKEREWDKTASLIGYALGAIGGAALFTGSVLALARGNTSLESLELICALVVATTVVIVFALPIANKGKPTRPRGRRKHRTKKATKK